MNQLQGLIEKATLLETDLAAIENLAAVVDAHDSIKLKLNWMFLQRRSGEETNDFLYYEDGELVGYLAVYAFNKKEVEISGMVHPAHRRKGIFKSLMDRAQEEIKRRGIPRIIFILNHESEAGKAFAASFGAAYEFSEYQMELDKTQVQEPKQERIELVRAVFEQQQLLNELTSICFDKPQGSMKLKSREDFENPRAYRDLLVLNGEVIGKIGITFEVEGRALIFGFCVRPEHQGRGYGREALSRTISQLLATGPLMVELEVASANEGALGLYQSCGFVVTQRMDYFTTVTE